MKVFFLLLFLANAYVVCATSCDCPDVFLRSDDNAKDYLYPMPSTRLDGLYIYFHEKPERDSYGNISFCFLKRYNSAVCVKEVTVNCECKETSAAVFTVRNVASESKDPLFCVECKMTSKGLQKPITVQTVQSDMCTLNYPLPFVKGKKPQLRIQCQSHKATIVFDFGPNTKKSTTIDF